MFFDDKIDLAEKLASSAIVSVVVLVVWLLALVSVGVSGIGAAVVAWLSWSSFAVFLEVVVDFNEEHEGFLEISFLLVATFGGVSKDLEDAAKAAKYGEKGVLRLAIPSASAHLRGLRAFGFAGLGYPPLRSLGGVVDDYWVLIWVVVVWVLLFLFLACLAAAIFGIFSLFFSHKPFRLP